MSKKQWMVLLMLFLIYLLLGASIFYHIESRLEIERVKLAKQERIEINALLHQHYVPSLSHGHDEILGKLTQYCGKSVYNYTEGETDPLKWDFYNSFYFAYTVVSTIGYGNLAPTNMLGRILMIFYGVVGIPMNGILLTQLGEFFGHVFVKAHQKYKSYKHGRSDYYPRKLTSFETRKVGLAAQIFVYLTPGFVMFIFFPAFLFSHYEGWSYDEAVYYAFVTLTTIGFGDYVAGQDNSKGSGVLFIFYKTFLICWISFGLGYIVMIMTFIARGMRSKKITRLEHKLALNLKHTQSKIWNEFNKEVDYLRRVFNELQLSKVKRVYVDEYDYEIPSAKLPRSNSFPGLRDLTYGGHVEENGGFPGPRRRANSEVVPLEDHVTRVVSETDLQRIDKTATFAAHAMVQPAELLARLVNILGYIPPTSEDMDGEPGSNADQETRRKSKENCVKDFLGKRAMSDSYGPSWVIGNDRIPRPSRPRSRAASEVRLPEKKNEEQNGEWTWSGPAASRKIQELMKARTKENGKPSRLRSLALSAKSVPKALLPSAAWRGRFSMSSEKKNLDSEPENAARNSEKDDKSIYPERERIGMPHSAGQSSLTSPDRRDSTLTSVSRRHYYTHTGAANQTSVATEGSNLLEETSLADFLRALTLLHASVDTAGSWTGADDGLLHRNKPRRKMGTACLTPPKLPSLFTLFSSPPTNPASASTQNKSASEGSNGRLSLGVIENSTTPPREVRRGSLALAVAAAAAANASTPATSVRPRRFSLRPVATPTGPPTPPKMGSPFLSNSRREPPADNRESANRPSFMFESPKEPLIRMEGPVGTSSPIKPPLNPRRFSLRPIRHQSGLPLGSSTVVSTSKGTPRWKAGMLQRQIGQMNLRRRARAFSLSDFQMDPPENGDPLYLADGTSYKTKTNGETVGKNGSLALPEGKDVAKQDRFVSLNSSTPSFQGESVHRIVPNDATSEQATGNSAANSGTFLDFRNERSVEKESAGRVPGETRISVDSHEPLVEVKVDETVKNLQGYKTIPSSVAQNDTHDLTALEIETPESNNL